MGKFRKILLILGTSSLLFSCSSKKEDPSNTNQNVEEKSYSCLFIGNSFTFYGDIPGIVKSFAVDRGVNMEVDSVTKSSTSLLEHADNGTSSGAILHDKLNNNQYTDIILQEKSNYPSNHYTDFKNGVKTMKELIDSKQVNARVTLYETWAYDSLSSTLDIPQSEEVIRSMAKNVAKNNGITSIANVGEAFTYIYENHKSINLYYSDNKHPSYYGSYLAALVLFATITGQRVNEIKFRGTNGTYTSQGQNAYVSSSIQSVLINVAEKIVFNI